MDVRRAYLKELAARSAHLWGDAPPPGCLAGETGLETCNTVYRLKDGTVTAMSAQQNATRGRVHPAAFLGMRVVGWLRADAPELGVVPDWQPRAYAVLWRPRLGPKHASAVALTSATVSLRPHRESAPGQAA